jgi:ribokinase
MTAPHLLCLGSINADFQVRTSGPLEVEEMLSPHDFARLGGGKAANVAFLAHRLGHPVMLFGRVGDDDLGKQALLPLREAGIALDHISVSVGMPTAVSVIAVPADGKKSTVLAGNANDSWDAASADAMVGVIAMAPEDSILAVDFEIEPSVACRAIDVAHALGLRVVLDPAPSERVPISLLAACHAVTPDAGEAAALTGIDASTVEGAGRAAAALAARGVPIVCIKLGDGGTVLAAEGRLSHIPPISIAVAGGIGVGDAYMAALATALLEGAPPLPAALFATAAAHLAVMDYGAQEPYPDRRRIDAFMLRLAVHDLRL